MAEAFIRTIKRDYVGVNPCPDAETVMRQLSAWFGHYTRFARTRHSHIVYPVSSLQLAGVPDRVPSFGGLGSLPHMPFACVKDWTRDLMVIVVDTQGGMSSVQGSA
jgi:hypothetical protein